MSHDDRYDDRVFAAAGLAKSAGLQKVAGSGMTVLSRYVKKNALWAIVGAVLGLWALQLLFSYLSELENLTDSYTMKDALTYIWYRSPYFLEQFIPTGALLGAVVGLGLLANNSELVVMRASGISVYRIVGWVLQPALLFVLLALIINQYVLPHSNQLAKSVNGGKQDSILSVRGYWTVQPRLDAQGIRMGKDILYIDYADVHGNIGEVKRWRLDDSGNVQSATRALGGRYVGSESVAMPAPAVAPEPATLAPEPVDAATGKQRRYLWQLQQLSHIQIGSQRQSQQSRQAADILSLPIEPESVYLLTRPAADLSLTQLYAHQQFMQRQGNRSLDHELAFWQKLLSPLAILSLVLVACSFVFGSLRTHSLGLRIVVALLFGLLFSYVQDLVGFVSLATGVSPLLMVLLPIVASALLGLYLLKRQG